MHLEPSEDPASFADQSLDRGLMKGYEQGPEDTPAG